MEQGISQADYDRLGALLEADPVDRETLLRSFGLSPEQEAFQRALLNEATRHSTYDDGIAAIFPTLIEPLPPEPEGFRIIRELGRGASGVVSLAEDIELHRLVALKFSRGFGSAQERDELIEEARLAAKLDHPGILRVLQIGKHEGGVFIASAFVDGPSLRAHLEGLRIHEGRPPHPEETEEGPVGAIMEDCEHTVSAVLALMRRLAEATAYAHAEGVVHRDLKPSNIILNDRCEPVIADFGIAGDVANLHERRRLVGTLSYMSPEQAGAIDDPVGPPTDQYALGVLLYELLTLEKPYQVDTSAELLAYFERIVREEGPRREGDAAPILGKDPRLEDPTIPASVAEICRRAMAIYPADRYASTTEFRDAIDRAIAEAHPRGVRVLGVNVRVPSLPTTAAVLALGLLSIATVAVYLSAGSASGTGSGGSPGSAGASGPQMTISLPHAREVIIERFEGSELAPIARHKPEEGPLEIAVDPGTYRITVVRDEFVREITRVLEERDTFTLQKRWVPPTISEAPMVFVSGGEYVVGMPNAMVEGQQLRTVTLSPFWMDQREVSNAEYRAFVDATGHRAPPSWPTPYAAALDDLPAVGVSQADARAYAEWAGKRLPTEAEWEVAAAGKECFRFPWGNESRVIPTLKFGADKHAAALGNFDDPTQDRLYRSSVVPVTEVLDETPSGIINLASNVAEWTDTVFKPNGGSSVIAAAVVRGNAFQTTDISPLENQNVMLQVPNARSFGVGFRCARTEYIDNSNNID